MTVEISSLADIGNVVSEKKIKIFGIGGLPTTRVELCSLVPDFELICSNETGEIASIKEKCKVAVFDLKNNPGSKKPEDIISDEKVVEHIKQASEGKTVGIYVMKSSTVLEKVCEENGWIVLAAKFDLHKKLDERGFFCEILKRIGFKKKSATLALKDLEGEIESLFGELGEKIVIQSSLGAGGRGTFFVEKNNRDNVFGEINERIRDLGGDENSSLTVSSFVNGADVGAMGCVTSDNGVLTAYPRYQIIDFKESVEKKDDGKGVFCGHDWSRSDDMPKGICDQAKDLLQKVGGELKKEGYLGIFGMDFIYDKSNQKLVPLEINPRLLGSFPVCVYVQKEKLEIPLVLFHVLEFLGIKYEIENENVYKKSQKREGSHLILFNFWGKEVEFREGLEGGVYCVKNGKLKFLRNGFELSDIVEKEKEFILFDGVPVPGKKYEKNKKILRILSKKSFFDKTGKVDKPTREFIQVLKTDLDSRLV